ncbi:OmpA family protein [Zhongshania guokunii]|uniref:OmpA family protein n=1 Tax=Zhongshania guokunii TaxID=641783 RepID=A0ABV3U422_9GAMM
MIVNLSRPLCLLVLLLLPLSVAHAGLILDVLNQTGVLAVTNSVTKAVGIELDDSLGGLDAGVSRATEALPVGALVASDELLAMDQGVLAADEGAAVNTVAPLGSAKDQPALVPLTSIDPVFVAGRIQSDTYACADADGDGVCDQDDQCLQTPRGLKTLANGCHLDGPQTLLLEGVFFAHNSAALNSSAKLVLDRVVLLIQQSDARRIEVGGYTDNIGSTHYNLRLSETRALAVRKYLLSQGLNAERLVAKGYGEESPRADNGTAEGRDLNRRVELKRLR